MCYDVRRIVAAAVATPREEDATTVADIALIVSAALPITSLRELIILVHIFFGNSALQINLGLVGATGRVMPFSWASC